MDIIMHETPLWELWLVLSAFVKNMCQGRDPSHGYDHAERVVINSFNIIREEVFIDDNLDFRKDVLMVSALHDVADHKYDKDGNFKKNVQEFLEKYCNNPILLMNIIDRISFSKEDKCIKNKENLDWPEVLGTYGCRIRNIVSDADKLEAIGLNGLARCIEYTKEKYFEENQKEIQKDLLKQQVAEHAQEKLLRLKDEFIRTEAGKKLAEPLHKEMLDYLEQII